MWFVVCMEQLTWLQLPSTAHFKEISTVPRQMSIYVPIWTTKDLCSQWRYWLYWAKKCMPFKKQLSHCPNWRSRSYAIQKDWHTFHFFPASDRHLRCMGKAIKLYAQPFLKSLHSLMKNRSLRHGLHLRQVHFGYAVQAHTRQNLKVMFPTSGLIWYDYQVCPTLDCSKFVDTWLLK